MATKNTSEKDDRYKLRDKFCHTGAAADLLRSRRPVPSASTETKIL